MFDKFNKNIINYSLFILFSITRIYANIMLEKKISLKYILVSIFWFLIFDTRFSALSISK